MSGYVLAGLGTGESPAQRQQIVEAVLQRLPAGAPRLLSSVGTPEEVLEAVAQVGTGAAGGGQGNRGGMRRQAGGHGLPPLRLAGFAHPCMQLRVHEG